MVYKKGEYGLQKKWSAFGKRKIDWADCDVCPPTPGQSVVDQSPPCWSIPAQLILLRFTPNWEVYWLVFVMASTLSGSSNC
ncbi:hypothetical protein CEXT_169961 [Caerostris extrusa]|uniref:Uncharacterized protein n=1 Tax=Caerostris extrusa TaxID=172846 RepID=A0AAV4PV41_CAEEX|nr:hypothetical protein CEXT_169961 [Caerostris extrusa]